MKANKAKNRSFKAEALVAEYLRLDPGALAKLGAKDGASHGSCERGLHEFMRRTLERAIGFLWMPDEAIVRLRAAKVPGWPDARTYNLAQLLAWALAREPRRLRGLPQLPLYPADTTLADFPRKPECGIRTSTLEVVAAAVSLFTIDFDAMRDAPGPDARQPVSVSQLIREMLGVQPQRLILPYYDAPKDAEAAYARDPEGQVIAGLSACMMRLLHNYPAILEAQKQIGCIAFWIGTDDRQYAEPDGVAAANIRALLMAGLCADGANEVVFVGAS